MQQIISDLTLKQYTQDEEIKKLKSYTKNRQHEYRNLQKKLNSLSEKNTTNDPSTSTELTSQSPEESSNTSNNQFSNPEEQGSPNTPITSIESNTESSYFIPTSNQYSTLQNQDETTDTPSIQEQMNIGTNDEQQSILQNQAETTDTSIPSVEHIETKDQQQTTLPKEYNSETIILCDSNGHRLDTNRLCPCSTTSYIGCPKLAKAKDIINEVIFNTPKTFILHCGTQMT